MISNMQVKPLEWRDSDFPKSPEAMSGPVQYSVCYDDDCERNDNDQPYQLVRHGYEDVIMGSYFREEDARAAAQADYEARILSALVPAPAVPDDVAGTLSRIIPILDHEFASRDHLILNCALGQITLGDVMDLRATIEAQAAELARLRQEAARIADDYHQERGQEILALSEMREAIAALAQPTGDRT